MLWSLAWSSVAEDAAAAEACLRMFRVRVEGARFGLWKRVMGSRVLLWWVVSFVGGCNGRGTYKAKHFDGWMGLVGRGEFKL